MSAWRELLGKETEFRGHQFAYEHTTAKGKSQDSNPTLLDSQAHVPFYGIKSTKMLSLLRKTRVGRGNQRGRLQIGAQMNCDVLKT